MMKKTFIFGLMALGLMSCNKDVTLSVNPGEGILFNGAYVNNVTKAAADITTGNLKNVAIFGSTTKEGVETQIFDNVKLSESAGSWTYTGQLQYWVKDNTYKFAAVAPYSEGHWTLAKEGLTFDSKAANEEVDLVFATKSNITGQASGNSKVAFELGHMLSKVKFTFTNGFAAESSVKLVIKNVKIAGVSDQMILDATAKTWGATDVLGVHDLNYLFADNTNAASNQIAQTASSVTEHKYLFPGSFANTISFDIDMYQNGAIAQTVKQEVTIPDFTLVMGHSYNLTAEINAANFDGGLEPIEFSVTVAPWLEDEDQTVPNQSL